MPRAALAALAMILPLTLLAQETPRFRSTEIAPDHTVTFRYLDPTATQVDLVIDGTATPIPMVKDSAGLWSATTAPLSPEIYSYHFESAKQRRLDPHNTRLTVNLLNLSNLLAVPGTPAEPWEPTPVPHGVIHHHLYTTSAVTGLPANQSEFYVYTPPGYDAKAKSAYPVLYLLHGWSDTADAWAHVGQAHLILDNLIAQGKARPMLVVMPLGYGTMSYVIDGGGSVRSSPTGPKENLSHFSDALLTEILPRVESTYNVSRKREDRAIAGLSMGGFESLNIGLTHGDRFAWVGGFSSGLRNFDFATELSSLAPNSPSLRLLWIACGTSDALIEPNRAFVAWLKSRQIPVTAVETPGYHSWLVWRDNLVHFAPLLFQPAK